MTINTLSRWTRFGTQSKTWLELAKRWYTEEPAFDWPDKKPKLIDCGPDLEDRGICNIDAFNLDKCYEQPRVVIIGAGIAGLTAAARLAKRGITNFVILEAYNRPGGRIWTGWVGDVSVELGTGWTQSNCAKHIVYDLKAFHYPPEPGIPGAEYHRGLFNQPITGRMETPPSIKAFFRYKQLEEEAKQLFYLGGSKQHGSIVNFMSLRIQQELHDFPESQQHDAARLMFGLAHMALTRGRDDTAMMWADFQGCFMSMPGGYVRVPLGITGLLAPLLRDIPSCCIYYCKPVNIIYWGTTPRKGYRAIVSTGDGCEYPADYVLVTVPLGVLANRYGTMFCPALPGCKTNAINCITCGHCNKVYLEYSRPFWYWSNKDICFEFNECELCFRNDWTRGIKSIEAVPNSDHVLCVILTGMEAVIMESISDCDVANGITDILRWATGNFYIPDPCFLIRSHWSSDPFFYGAYSLCCCPGNPMYQLALGAPIPGPDEPIPPILLFAGEATVPGYCGTLSGARLSGIREAERIVSLTRLHKGPPLCKDESVPVDPCACVPCPCPSPCPGPCSSCCS